MSAITSREKLNEAIEVAGGTLQAASTAYAVEGIVVTVGIEAASVAESSTSRPPKSVKPATLGSPIYC